MKLARVGFGLFHDGKVHWTDGEGVLCGLATYGLDHMLRGPTAWGLKPPKRYCSPCWRLAKEDGVSLAEKRRGNPKHPYGVKDLPGQLMLPVPEPSSGAENPQR